MKPKLKHVSESDIDRLKEIVAFDKEKIVPREREKYEAGNDSHGGSTRELLSFSRAVAFKSYLVDSDIKAFREHLEQCAQYQIELFERYEKGDRIGNDWVSMQMQREIYLPLAAGTFELAISLAKLIGGRPDLEKACSNPFVRNIGYTLKYVVLKNAESAWESLEKFKPICAKEGKAYQPFAPIFEGILKGDAASVSEHFVQLLKGHRRICGNLHPIMDRHIAICPLGLINLARGMYGLDVEVKNDLVPQDLIVDVGIYP